MADTATLVNALREAGLAATWEHPGAVLVPYATGDYGSSWWFGTVNGHWGGDLVSDDGRVLRSIDLGIDRDSDDVSAIALAIGRALLTQTCPSCGALMTKEHGAINERVFDRCGRVARATRPATFLACPSCEHCEEVTSAS